MISAIILAAGQSKRMGRPKMILPWGNTTVIGRVIQVLKQADLGEVVVVTGAARQEVEAVIEGMPARLVYNPDYAEGEMLSTFQTGLGALDPHSEAALVALGDQPQIEAWVVQSVINAYKITLAPLVVPSFKMKRGHPWLLDRSLWPSVFSLKSPDTMRDFLNLNAGKIHYLVVETASVLEDLDTPDDYHKYQPDSK